MASDRSEPAPVLAAEDVRVRLGGVEVVAGVSLLLHEGEIMGLVGESGSGKTTLCRALLRLQPLSGGQVSLDGTALAAWPERALRRRMQMLLQDSAASLSPRMTVRALLDEPVAIHHLPRAAAAQSLAALMRQLRLPEDVLGRYPHQLSGGQAHRVAVARALLLDPAVLVADEPTAGLDVSVQGELLNLLLDSQASRGLCLLLVSHNLPVVRRVAARVAVMYLGQVVELGPTATVLGKPAHPYTAALTSAVPVIGMDSVSPPVVLAGDVPSPAKPPSGCRFHTRCPIAQPVCRSSPPELAEVSPTRYARCHFPSAATSILA